jgi:regulator of sigma E protease
MNVLIALAAFAVALGILVVVHEWGHYSVARLAGVKVLRFSVGFGRPVLRWTGRGGDRTEWTVGWLPIGGYVKMLDERDADTPVSVAERPRAFNRQPVGKRMAIVAAGPAANFLLAIALFAALYLAGVSEPASMIAPPEPGSIAAQAGLRGAQRIVAVLDEQADPAATTTVRSWAELRFRLLDLQMAGRRAVTLVADGPDGQTRAKLRLPDMLAGEDGPDVMDALGLAPGGKGVQIARVEPDSAAQAAGLRERDRVVAVDGAPVTDARAFVAAVNARPGATLALTVERDGQPLPLAATPRPVHDGATGRTIGRLGAAIGNVVETVDVHYGPLEALGMGVRRTWEISVFSVRMFGRMIVGEASLKNLSGPVTIADYAGRSARMGLASFISFMALVSISLGVLNLLPIPVLDGGHLLYYSVEVVTGKAISERAQQILQRVGVACVLGLSALALCNDLARLLHF